MRNKKALTNKLAAWGIVFAFGLSSVQGRTYAAEAGASQKFLQKPLGLGRSNPRLRQQTVESLVGTYFRFKARGERPKADLVRGVSERADAAQGGVWADQAIDTLHTLAAVGFNGFDWKKRLERLEQTIQIIEARLLIAQAGDTLQGLAFPKTPLESALSREVPANLGPAEAARLTALRDSLRRLHEALKTIYVDTPTVLRRLADALQNAKKDGTIRMARLSAEEEAELLKGLDQHQVAWTDGTRIVLVEGLAESLKEDPVAGPVLLAALLAHELLERELLRQNVSAEVAHAAAEELERILLRSLIMRSQNLPAGDMGFLEVAESPLDEAIARFVKKRLEDRKQRAFKALQDKITEAYAKSLDACLGYQDFLEAVQAASGASVAEIERAMQGLKLSKRIYVAEWQRALERLSRGVREALPEALQEAADGADLLRKLGQLLESRGLRPAEALIAGYFEKLPKAEKEFSLAYAGAPKRPTASGHAFPSLSEVAALLKQTEADVQGFRNQYFPRLVFAEERGLAAAAGRSGRSRPELERELFEAAQRGISDLTDIDEFKATLSENLYDILGIQPTTDPDIIQNAYGDALSRRDVRKRKGNQGEDKRNLRRRHTKRQIEVAGVVLLNDKLRAGYLELFPTHGPEGGGQGQNQNAVTPEEEAALEVFETLGLVERLIKSEKQVTKNEVFQAEENGSGGDAAARKAAYIKLSDTEGRKRLEALARSALKKRGKQDRLGRSVRRRLRMYGFTPMEIERLLTDGAIRLEDGQMRLDLATVRAISKAAEVGVGKLLQKLIFHERLHQLLSVAEIRERLASARVFQSLKEQIPAKEWRAFIKEYGMEKVSEEEIAEEWIVKTLTIEVMEGWTKDSRHPLSESAKWVAILAKFQPQVVDLLSGIALPDEWKPLWAEARGARGERSPPENLYALLTQAPSAGSSVSGREKLVELSRLARALKLDLKLYTGAPAFKRPERLGDESTDVVRSLASILVFEYVQGLFPKLDVSSLSELGLDLAALQAGLEGEAHRVVREKITGVAFEPLEGAAGGMMNVYETKSIPGIIIKMAKSPEQFEHRILPGYQIAKDRLGGLFVTMVLEDVDLRFVGEEAPRHFKHVIVQEKVTVIDAVLQELEGQRDEARRVGNNALADEKNRQIEQMKDTFVKLSLEIRKRGAFDLDLTNWRHNYGLTRSGRLVAFDVDHFMPLWDVSFARYRNVLGFAFGGDRKLLRAFSEESLEASKKEAALRGTEGVRVPDVFEKEVLESQEAYLRRVLAAQGAEKLLRASKLMVPEALKSFLNFSTGVLDAAPVSISEPAMDISTAA